MGKLIEDGFGFPPAMGGLLPSGLCSVSQVCYPPMRYGLRASIGDGRPPLPGARRLLTRPPTARGDRSPVLHCDGRASQESVGNWPMAIITSDALGGTPVNW